MITYSTGFISGSDRDTVKRLEKKSVAFEIYVPG